MARTKRTKKWDDLYKSTMRWQKRARQKASRLRKKGATAEEIARVSSIKPAGELQKMSYYELQRYRHSLSEFSDRGTGFTVLKSGELLSRKESGLLKRTLAAVNRARARVRQWLSSVQAKGAVDIERKWRERQFLDPITHKPTAAPRGTSSPFEPVVMGEQPATRKIYKQRLEVLQRMRERTFEEVASAHRKSAVDMARQMGGDDLADAIAGLSDFELEFAIERMGLLEDLSLWYTSSADFARGVATAEELDPEGHVDALAAITQRVETIKRMM